MVARGHGGPGIVFAIPTWLQARNRELDAAETQMKRCMGDSNSNITESQWRKHEHAFFDYPIVKKSESHMSDAPTHLNHEVVCEACMDD